MKKILMAAACGPRWRIGPNGSDRLSVCGRSTPRRNLEKPHRMKRKHTVRRALVVATLAALLGYNSAFAQNRGTSSASGSALGMGRTSPLGTMGSGSSVGPIGVPLGSTGLGSAGISPLPLPSVAAPGMGLTSPLGTMGSGSPVGSGSPLGTTGLGSVGINPASSGTAPSVGLSSPLGTMGTGSSVGPVGIPLGATQLGSGGLSPSPVPTTSPSGIGQLANPAVNPLVNPLGAAQLGSGVLGSSPAVAAPGTVPSVAPPSSTTNFSRRALNPACSNMGTFLPVGSC
jgi:hypothetical protein